MPDAHFEHPRLASIYDALDPDRADLDPYVSFAEQCNAGSVLDIGCGTGVLAAQLVERGVRVVGLDPAAGSLAVARARPGADGVRWIHGDATALAHVAPPVRVDLVTMTANTAQAITEPDEWAATLHAAHAALTPGGHLIFETRDREAQAWKDWTRPVSERTRAIDGVGAVTTWVEVTRVDGPLVTFTSTFAFESDGCVLTSESTLRFRDRRDLEADLETCGFTVVAVSGVPDRPGRELVVLARRPVTS